MARYFFNIRGAAVQSEGIDLSDDKHAWSEGTRLLGEIVKDMDGDLEPGTDWLLEIANEQGQVIYRLHLETEKRDPN